MEQEDGSTTSAAIAEERMEESTAITEERMEESDIYSGRKDSESSSYDSPWNYRYPPEYYREWDGQYVMEWNEIPYSDPPSSASSSRCSSIIENLDDSVKDLSPELEKLLEAKARVQSKLEVERKKCHVDKIVIDEVQSWFIHVDKSIKLMLRPKFPMKLLPWSKPQRKKVIAELKRQAEDLVDAIAQIPIKEELKQLKVQTFYFSLKQIEVATDNFNPENKIGEGSFGPVYKGVLKNGFEVAVKQFSSKSEQGKCEFVNEIRRISAMQHRNIVDLFGCCIERSQLLLIYEFLENGSLERVLLERSLDWQTRHKISLDIARGLAYLHEESRQKIVHRDIKATNILLDRHLNAKISGFGLAIFDDDIDEYNNPPVGTYGHMVPVYLTEKADVYNYGVVLLEIVSGKMGNTNYGPKEDSACLIDWARALKDQGKLLDLVDPSMGSNFSVTKADQMLNLALLCIDPLQTHRPNMTSVVNMIEGVTQPVTVPVTTAREQLNQLKLQTSNFSFEQIKVATDNFDRQNFIWHESNKAVYKGVLQDGSIVAIKTFSSRSEQGNREIVNEIGMLSALQHRNLVKVFGCCVERSQLIIIYEYFRNESLGHALFGPESSRLSLDWQRRLKISLDIARGLAYLHEESGLKIVHGDIKATNILLGKLQDAKITDSDLVKLYDEENTHISTGIVGTFGYIDPVYVSSGHLTDKADVYSYGVLLLEIFSGKKCYSENTNYGFLLDWARSLKDQGNLLDLVDPNMDPNFFKTMVEQMLNLALLCTNDDPTLRPTMTSVVRMIGGNMEYSSVALSSFGDAIPSSMTTRPIIGR